MEASWSKHFSKTHNRDYWFNAKDGTRSWEPPVASNANTKLAASTIDDEDDSSSKTKRARISTSETIVTVTPAVTPVLREDFPFLSEERMRMLTNCYDIFVSENMKFGEMGGSSKTAKACKKDGMKIGMQGMFGRIVWTQLLKHVQNNGDIGTDPNSDAVFVPCPVVDEAVMQELVEAGRSPIQAQSIMRALYDKLAVACAALVKQHSSLTATSSLQEAKSVAVTLQGKLQSDGQLCTDVMYSLAYGSTSHIISGTHLKKLLGLYRSHTLQGCLPTDATFLRRVFCVIARYELLSGSSDGYQMAFPDVGFRWLRDRMGVTAECFASPLNCWNGRFCSVARDTDRFFGSMGNFFHFSGVIPPSLDAPQDTEGGGSFEANPPFVESIMNEMAAKIERMLSSSERWPVSFVVIVPAWTDCLGIKTMTNSQFLRPHAKYVLRLEKKKHNYRPGMQHRTDHVEQPSNVDTLVFFLQNDAGARRWPVTLAMAQDLEDTVNIL